MLSGRLDMRRITILAKCRFSSSKSIFPNFSGPVLWFSNLIYPSVTFWKQKKFKPNLSCWAVISTTHIGEMNTYWSTRWEIRDITEQNVDENFGVVGIKQSSRGFVWEHVGQQFVDWVLRRWIVVVKHTNWIHWKIEFQASFTGNEMC